MHAVIAWVNGDDPVHRAKRLKYSGKTADVNSDDIGGETRFKSMGEIHWCVASINRFAPFISKIFIVSDAQDPNLGDFLSDNFEHPIPIEIVDHKVLFRGYEAVLPTFNSLSIETMLFNIPGLDEQFVYFNDDFMLLSEIKPEDWFDKEGRAVVQATRWSAWFAALLRAIKPDKNGHKPFGHKDAMLNAADLLGKDHFWYFGHAPSPLLKSVLRDWFEKNQGALEENISYRFRNPLQYNPQQLFCLLAEDMELLKITSPHNHQLFLKPDASKPDYMRKHLKRADANPHLMYGCVNSLDKAAPEERDLWTEWINRRLGLKEK